MPAVTHQTSDENERRLAGEQLDQIRINLGQSIRAMAEKIEVDRETLRRVFAGDPTVRASKWKMIEKRIHALDAEMSSERPPEPAKDPAEVVEFRVEPAAGQPGATVTLRGSISDLPALQEAVERLIESMSRRTEH
jgi:hypothetical protein